MGKMDQKTSLEHAMKAFGFLEKYVGGDASVKDAAQAEFARVMKDDDDRGYVMLSLGNLAVSGDVTTRHIVDVTKNERFGGVVEHYLRHAQETETKLRGFSRYEAEEMWDRLVEKHTLGATGLVAKLRAKATLVCPGCPMRSWQLQGERSRGGGDSNITRTRLNRVLDEKSGKAPSPDPKAELMAALEKAKAAKAAALQAEDPEVLRETKAKIARLEAELKALETVAPPPVKVATPPAPQATGGKKGKKAGTPAAPPAQQPAPPVPALTTADQMVAVQAAADGDNLYAQKLLNGLAEGRLSPDDVVERAKILRIV